MDDTLKKKLFLIIFGTDTPEGKRYDVALLWIILLSVIVVFFDSVPELHDKYANFFLTLEWFFTIIFTIEYFVRIMVSPKPLKYIFSWWGFIDLISFLPTYFSLLFTGAQFLIAIRALRLARIFRIFKLTRFNEEANFLVKSLRDSSYKLGVFLGVILMIIIVLGTVMYLVEGPANGYTSIPQSIYWAIVTVTTVGYGDIAPQTPVGKIISAIAMIISYTIITVPTGIVASEISSAKARRKKVSQTCDNCSQDVSKRAKYCRHCGNKLQN